VLKYLLKFARALKKKPKADTTKKEVGRMSLEPLKVMIVEDDLMIAETLDAALTDAGYDVCGIATTVPEAVALSRHHRPDLAVVDVRLADGGQGPEIIAQLGGVGKMGVLYATGNKTTLKASDGHAYILKPYTEPDILRALQIVAEIVAIGTASPPIPRGFKVLAS
jgi:ActR/RegA family two-component response regulator